MIGLHHGDTSPRAQSVYEMRQLSKEMLYPDKSSPLFPLCVRVMCLSWVCDPPTRVAATCTRVEVVVMHADQWHALSQE